MRCAPEHLRLVPQADVRVLTQIGPLPTPYAVISALWQTLATRDSKMGIRRKCRQAYGLDAGCQRRASKIILNGVSVARLTEAKPPAVMTSRNFASPA